MVGGTGVGRENLRGRASHREREGGLITLTCLSKGREAAETNNATRDRIPAGLPMPMPMPVPTRPHVQPWKGLRAGSMGWATGGTAGAGGSMP